jgi:hypothetical protein
MVGHPYMEREHHVSTRLTARSLAIRVEYEPSRRREDRTPPCHLPTSYITSRASVGECASPLATPAKVLPTLIVDGLLPQQ